MAYGLESPALPLLVIGGVSVGAYFITGGGLIGIYGISAATMGVLVSTGIIMASDTFGPIADNADGIAEMAGVADEVGSSLEELDGVGNVTKAVTKGYAMATCILTAVVILFAYLTEAAKDAGISLEHISDITVNISHPIAIAALFIGASVPFLFAALTIKAVGKTAFEMADEVRRQFREDPGILKGTSKPDYKKCINISTKNALNEMILPTAVGVIFPVVMGFLIGVWYLAVYLLAVKVVSGLLAMFMR